MNGWDRGKHPLAPRPTACNSARMRLALLALTLALPACQNSCQAICGRMARFAEDCGQTVPQDQVRACIDAQSGSASSEDRQTCRSFGSLSNIESEWTCDDIAVYFARQAPAAGDTAEESSLR